jgi:hypothetical protein
VRLPLVVLFTVLNHLAYTGSRVTVSLFALLSMLISVPVGRLVDRIGVGWRLRRRRA